MWKLRYIIGQADYRSNQFSVAARYFMNTQLVEFLTQAIRSLATEERAALEKMLFFDADELTTDELATLVLKGSSFDFLADEPDLYSLDDGGDLSKEH